MSRTMPTECRHGVTVDWGDFGPCQNCDDHGYDACPNLADCPECDQRWIAEATEVIKAWGLAWDALPDSWREGRLGQSKAAVVTEYIWKTQVET